MIKAENLSFSYAGPDSRVRALKNLSFHIEKGEFVVILGRNGSGKSTLARHFNCLIPLQSGKLEIAGLDASKPDNLRKIRRKCGMVFQNPDNQFVSTLAAEDIAFGLRNFDVPEEDIPAAVSKALHAAGLDGFEDRTPQFLSGGQKQRLALAGILALEPEIIILDEASSMLDSKGRHELNEAVIRLHRSGKTIIMISHFAEDAAMAQRVFIMKSGKLAAEGSPREILSNSELLASAGLAPPFSVRIYQELLRAGVMLPYCPLKIDELGDAICQLL